SVRHTPHSARLRALCTHAPSSCHTMPTDCTTGGSDRSHRLRISAPAAKMATIETMKARRLTSGSPAIDEEDRRLTIEDVAFVEPAAQRIAREEEIARIGHVRKPVLLLQGDDRRRCGAQVGQQTGRPVTGMIGGKLEDHRPAPEKPGRASPIAVHVHPGGKTEYEDPIVRTRRLAHLAGEIVHG